MADYQHGQHMELVLKRAELDSTPAQELARNLNQHMAVKLVQEQEVKQLHVKSRIVQVSDVTNTYKSPCGDEAHVEIFIIFLEYLFYQSIKGAMHRHSPRRGFLKSSSSQVLFW